MRQPDRRFRMSDTTLLAGWLFADLLLALAVIFLSAYTVGVKPKAIATPVPTVTIVPTLSPSPIPTFVTPTPTPLPRLELDPHRVTLPIDPNGLLNNSPAAINQLKQEVRALVLLRGRSVGLVIAYGGAPTVNDIGRAQQIATNVMNVLQSLGSGGFAPLATAKYYDPLYNLYNTDTVATLDLYLFSQHP